MDNLVLFDGDCNLCNKAVQFIIKRDQHSRFRFASLQSSFARDTLSRHGNSSGALIPNTFFLVDGGKLYSRSTAALRVFSALKNYGWMKVFYLVPTFIRDAVYRFIARNRFRWFGRAETCWVMKPEWRNRFLG